MRPARAALARLAPSLLVLLILAADRATKAWALDWLRPRGGVPVFSFLHLTYVENLGSAFGLVRDANLLLGVVAAALTVALVVWRRRLPPQAGRQRVALSMILAGAAGNLYDRLAYGFVVDFVDLRVWPVFNVADSAITVGACWMAVELWLEDRARERAQRAKA